VICPTVSTGTSTVASIETSTPCATTIPITPNCIAPSNYCGSMQFQECYSSFVSSCINNDSVGVPAAATCLLTIITGGIMSGCFDFSVFYFTLELAIFSYGNTAFDCQTFVDIYGETGENFCS